MEDDSASKDAGPNWLKLSDAFHRLGKVLFIGTWDNQSINLSPGRFRYAIPIDIYRPDYDLKYVLPEQHDQGIRMAEERGDFVATEDMVNQYGSTRELLFDSIWEGKIGVQTIGEDGKEVELPQEVWKSKTGEWEISLPDSEIVQRKEDIDIHTWQVSILSDDIERLISTINDDHKKSVRQKAAQINPNKGGAPEKYDWALIESYISEELRESDEGTSNAEIARQVEARLLDEGIEPPVDSALRSRIASIKKT